MTFYKCYRPHRFNVGAQATVDQANHIIEEMRGQGYVLTLRQLFYQFVRRNWLANEEREYKRLGRLITQARESGVVDWFAIEDRGRNVYGPNPQEDPAAVVNGVEEGLLFDQWARQDTYLEVWVEKQALEGVISRPCERLDVNYMACKGYLSASEAWRAGLRFRQATHEGKACVLVHLADHDPSGLNMTEDNALRLRLFAETHDVEVRRIAMNMDQVEEYGPPPNPTKESDSRSTAYIEQFGHDSWELDALEPSTLDDLIASVIEEYRDEDTWAEVLAEQTEARRPLAALSENWGAVQEFLERERMI